MTSSDFKLGQVDAREAKFLAEEIQKFGFGDVFLFDQEADVAFPGLCRFDCFRKLIGRDDLVFNEEFCQRARHGPDPSLDVRDILGVRTLDNLSLGPCLSSVYLVRRTVKPVDELRRNWREYKHITQCTIAFMD